MKLSNPSVDYEPKIATASVSKRFSFDINMWKRFDKKISSKCVILKNSLDSIELEEYNRMNVYFIELIEKKFNCKTRARYIRKTSFGYLANLSCHFKYQKKCNSFWTVSVNIHDNKVTFSEKKICKH